MNTAIECHDSDLLAVEQDAEGGGSIILDAYVHRTDGKPGTSPGEGGMQRIRIKADALSLRGEVGNLPAELYDGSLLTGTSQQNNVISFPAAPTGDFTLRLVLAEDGTVITATGTGLTITPEGEFRFVEMFRP